jgi:hypothetical protein
VCNICTVKTAQCCGGQRVVRFSVCDAMTLCKLLVNRHSSDNLTKVWNGSTRDHHTDCMKCDVMTAVVEQHHTCSSASCGSSSCSSCVNCMTSVGSTDRRCYATLVTAHKCSKLLYKVRQTHPPSCSYSCSSTVRHFTAVACIAL